MTTLARRLDAFEAKQGMNRKVLLALGGLTDDDWKAIRFNKNIHIIHFRDDASNEDKRAERFTDIKKLITSGKHICVISESDGTATWKDGQCIEDRCGSGRGWEAYRRL